MNYLSPINTRYQPSPFSNALFANWEDEFDKLFSGFPNLFDGGSKLRARAEEGRLSLRWYENDNAYVARIDLPGVNSKDVALEVGDNVLTLAAERKTQNINGESSAVRYRQSFTLPEGIDGDKATASYEDGVLSVTLPKSEAVKPRRIQIN